MYNLSELITRAQPLLGWHEADPHWQKLDHYLHRVREAGLALVSHGDRDRLIERHLLPSLEALPFIPETGTLMDVGSGGGFPAIPISFARLNLKIVCVESNSRKSAFLRRVSRETLLSNVQVIDSRVEDLDALQNYSFDVVTARAVADLPELIALTRRFLAPGGHWIFWKGQDWRREAELRDLNVKLATEQVLSDGGRLLVLVPLELESAP